MQRFTVLSCLLSKSKNYNGIRHVVDINQTIKAMIKKVVLALSVVGLLWSCGYKEKNERLQAKVDSLSVELKTSEEMANTLQDVGVLLDSIDLNRNMLRTSMIEGTSYDKYSERLKNLNEYVKATSRRIDEMETALKKAKSGSNQYASMVKKLKLDLEAK
jgi:hypothetical protein